MDNMNNNPSSKKDSKRPAIFILVMIILAVILYQYHVARIVFIVLFLLFILFGLFCYLLFKFFEKHENIPSWVDNLGIVAFFYFHLFTKIISFTDRNSNKLIYNTFVPLALLLFFLILLCISTLWIPVNKDPFPILSLYIFTTLLSIILTSHSFECLINHHIFKKYQAEYNAELVKSVIYMLYFVFLIAEAVYTIKCLYTDCQLSSLAKTRHIILCPAFLTLIAWERAFRS